MTDLQRTPFKARDMEQILRVDSFIMYNRSELKNFWCSMSIDDNWHLTEMSTAELSAVLSRHLQWETARAALHSYTKYAWEEDLLEITEDCVTIADDMYESKGMEDLLDAMVDAIVDNHESGGKLKEHDLERDIANVEAITHDEWDRRGRQMLETLVLCEFALKVAGAFLHKKEESRAAEAALEL